jgi:hypothetical protein
MVATGYNKQTAALLYGPDLEVTGGARLYHIQVHRAVFVRGVGDIAKP